MFRRIGQIHQLLDLAAFAARRFGVELNRILENFVGKLDQPGAFECGREQHGLLAPAGLGDDAIHLADEAHVQHAVGLIEDQNFDGAAVETLGFDVLHQTSRGGHYDVGGFGQGGQLFIVFDAPDDGLDDEMGVHGQCPGMLGDLQGQLAGWCQDQHPG